MKRYGICFLILAAIILACVLAGYAVTLDRSSRYESAAPIPNTVYETETVPENRVVINQEYKEPDTETVSLDRYLLVSETGYLLVFSGGEARECMQTHIPLTDFPTEEQDKLREGIWFESMMEVLCYLESFTS